MLFQFEKENDFFPDTFFPDVTDKVFTVNVLLKKINNTPCYHVAVYYTLLLRMF